MEILNQTRQEVLEAVKNGDMNVDAAASMLNISSRSVYRLLEKYKKKGVEAFVHGNSNQKQKNDSKPLVYWDPAPFEEKITNVVKNALGGSDRNCLVVVVPCLGGFGGFAPQEVV